MANERQFTLTANAKDYTLTIGEAMGTQTPKVMLTCTLRGDDKGATFALLIDSFVASVRASKTTQEQYFKEVYAAALATIEDYINDNEWADGKTYYGEMQPDGMFEITGTEKPEWEDGRWGTKAKTI